MPLQIPDEVLKQAGLTEREALVEFACRLFDAGKLTMPQASKLAGLSRDEFQAAAMDRGIPLFRPTLDEIRADVEALKRMGK